MTTAEIAIIVSITSVLLAGFSLGWNIYRDVVLKARLRLRFGVRTLVQVGNQDRPQYVCLSITNCGPGPVTLTGIQLKDTCWLRSLFGKQKHAVLIHDYENPLSGQLPQKLEVGQGLDLLFRYDARCMLKEGWSHIGINDSFGRVHWAPKQQVRDAVYKWRSDFDAE